MHLWSNTFDCVADSLQSMSAWCWRIGFWSCTCLKTTSWWCAWYRQLVDWSRRLGSSSGVRGWLSNFLFLLLTVSLAWWACFLLRQQPNIDCFSWKIKHSCLFLLITKRFIWYRVCPSSISGLLQVSLVTLYLLRDIRKGSSKEIILIQNKRHFFRGS